MEKTPFVGKVTVRYMVTRLLKPSLSWYAGGRLIALLRTFYVMHVFLVFSYTS